MAEFVDVVQKKNEICNYYPICEPCPLRSANNSHGIGCDSLIKNFPQDAEEIIMTWIHPVDWSKVEVDTPILVRDNENHSWKRRYFTKYENDKVYAWAYGATSWSASNKYEFTSWKYAKLAEEEK